ncbi:MAG: pyruvate kinase [Ignavibacteria bacterium GWA2_35_9]|nr:MAG: pyruvate kinase [Ignavibacteria bacterium GWA2_35_9]OGU47228.1 MAG: pyruvate kinase [Ignavibacteria bacterium GWB2_36_8]OGU50109.1 MAG: pyruvate kinase [Ignavibacteria bacterium GWC2_36_12]
MSTRLTEVFSKTKILCTLGPSTYTTEDIEKLILAGMDGVRLNFSHGDYDFYEKVFQNIYNACVEEKTPLAVLIDLQGPKIRIGELAELEIELITGEKIEITTENIKGTKARISTSYKRLVEDAAIGDAILIDDGLIRLRITGKKKDSVICEIENGDILKPKKGMNLPGMKISAQAVTEKDYRDLEFALSKRADFIALSFVRSANDIIILREWLKSKNNIKPIIAKIEKKEAVENFDEILEAADGIMVARGDLGVELLPQEVPVIQKMIIKKCNAIGKLVITATQMLESMIHNPIPTRAEASDVANAVWDGTDVVMLSGETSVGKFPLRSVQIMNDILKNTEFHLRPVQETELKIPESIEENLFDSVGRAISSISRQVKAEAIVTFTYKGRTAKNLSKFRPEAKIIALSNNFEIMNRLCLRWGVTSIYMEDIDKEKIAVDKAKKLILENGQVKEGDMVIFTAGAPYSEKSRANWLRFEVI